MIIPLLETLLLFDLFSLFVLYTRRSKEGLKLERK